MGYATTGGEEPHAFPSQPWTRFGVMQHHGAMIWMLAHATVAWHVLQEALYHSLRSRMCWGEIIERRNKFLTLDFNLSVRAPHAAQSGARSS